MNEQTWIIQRRILRSDWETITTAKGTRRDAEKAYGHLNGSVRVVSVTQAERDYNAGRADNYKHKLGAG